MPNPSSELYGFGRFTLDAVQRVVTRDEQRVQLAPKTFDLLLLLVRSPGRAFTKAELMTALWPDTFVEEANLSFQVSTLRKALGDGAAEWIETVPKHGYRFAAEVTASPHAAPAEPRVVGEPRPAVAGARTRTRWLLTAALVTSALVAGTYLTILRPGPLPAREDPQPIATPLTAYPGREEKPSLSPDGSQVAFTWDGQRQDNVDIYVKLVGPGEPLRLTTAPDRDDSPAWSPDGRHIAFLRMPPRAVAGPADLFVMPALGGAERRVASVTVITSRWLSELAWTPDSKWLAIGGRLSPADAPGIWLVEVDGPRRHRLTTAAPGMSDFNPVFAPDGRRMAFIRGGTVETHGPFVLTLSPALEPAGEPVRVANPRPGLWGVTWTPDGRSLLYSSGGHAAPTHLERLALSADSTPIGRPELLPFGERAMTMAVNATGRLVYSANLRDTNLWKLDLTRPGSPPEDAHLAPSTLDDHTPSYSPDGTRIVFASTRSGFEELWIANADGTSPRQVTRTGGARCSNPQWSPDGRTILFDSMRDGSGDLYLLDPDSLGVRRLTTDPSDETGPTWSRDGRWIFFGSNRTGEFHVWKMPSAGGSATQVTRASGETARESPDGRFLYYAKLTFPKAIWRIPSDGGEEEHVADGLSFAVNFVVGTRGVYFVAAGDALSSMSIEFVDFATGRQTTLATIGKRRWFGIALSPDERWLLFPVTDREGRDLMLVDNVR
jgi:Tol biopolymer transport system component/DNA-binding winged helix-turn-helix (wHTH) protein